MAHRKAEPPGMDEDLQEGEALGLPDVQQGGTHDNRLSHHERAPIQGPKTREGNLNRLKTGTADGPR